MAATPNSIITPQTPYFGVVSLANAAACATRLPTAIASMTTGNGFYPFVSTSTNGRKVDYVQVKACSANIASGSANQLVGAWVSDGTSGYLYKEIAVTSGSASTTAASFDSGPVTLGLVLPTGYSVYASTTVATATGANALSVFAWGADL